MKNEKPADRRGSSISVDFDRRNERNGIHETELCTMSAEPKPLAKQKGPPFAAGPSHRENVPWNGNRNVRRFSLPACAISNTPKSILLSWRAPMGRARTKDGGDHCLQRQVHPM